MKRVIITGGDGFIGRNLVKRLAARKVTSVMLISNTGANANFFKDVKSHKDMPIRFHRADIRDKRAILNIFRNEGADTCIHLAAKISVEESIKKPQETMDINVNGTLNVLEACHRSGVDSFVFASSAAVYGDVKKLPISEDESLKPLSPYGKSKMLAEELVLRYNKLRKIQNTASLRIFNVYGRDSNNESDVISRFAARLSMMLPPIIYDDGNHTRDFISVDDVVDGILLSVKAMENRYYGNLSSSPVFNMGSGTGTTINELACKMISISGLEVDPIYEKPNQDSGVILHSYADMKKTKRALQFVSRKDLETGLREILEPQNVS